MKQIFLFAVLFFSISACASQAEPPPTQSSEFVVRELPTTTPTTPPTETPIPTDTPIPPTPTNTPTLIPTNTPTLTPTITPTPECIGASPTRLSVDDRAKVINYQLNVRFGPSTQNPIVSRLSIDRMVTILDGPQCDDGQLWYYIKSDEYINSAGDKVSVEEELSPTLAPSATTEPTATFWPTVTRQILSKAEGAGLVPCPNRVVPDDLLFIVTQQFPLPESYVPPDLVLLEDYFDSSITLDQPLYARQIVIEFLHRIITEMNEAGLRPSIISAYRSSQEQAMAWKWWNSQYPGRVAIMSARSGYSEHQLGTTIDFGSPEINHLFHVDFANTAEGIWLANHAHRFGFILSYPAHSYDITGFKYEPWHYRYVGVEMARSLFDSGQILTSWQIENLPPPCIP